MSEKPTKWMQFCGQTRVSDEAKLLLRGTDLVVFEGPDREANARKFLHMDELELEVRKLCAYVEDLPTEEMVSGMPIVRRIDAILSKIEGKL